MQKCIDEKKFVDGEKIFDSYLNVDENNYDYYKLGGDIKFHVSKPIQAASLYRKALSLKPTEEVYYNLALIFYSTKQPENYIICMNELLKINPDNPKYLVLYAQHFASEGVYITAIENVSKALSNSNEKFELFLLRADYKFLYGDTIGAIMDCDSGIALDINNCKGYTNKVTYCVYSKKVDNILRSCNQAIQHGCDPGYFTFNKGLARLIGKDIIGARQELLKAINLNNPAAIAFVKNYPDERFRTLFTSALINK